MQSKTYAFDAAPGLVKRDVGLAALSADGFVGPQWDQGGATATDAILIANVESITASTDETYELSIVASNAANRSDAVVLGSVKIGKASAITNETVDAVAGDRVELRFRTEKNEKRYRYVDLYLDVAGTAPSIGLNAYLSKEI